MSVILENIAGMKSSVPLTEVLCNELDEKTFHRDFVSRSRPCIIRSAVNHWPAFKNWREKNYLIDRCGGYQVTLFPHNNFIAQGRGKGRKEMLFSEAIEILHAESTEVASLGALEVRPSGEFKELLNDVGGFPFLNNPPAPILYPASRYFVHRNAATGWHYHFADETLMCQVVGTKRIGLLEGRAEYFDSVSKILLSEQYYDSECSFGSGDCKNLHWYYAELREGDALYIPPAWWHGVVPTSKSFGITATMCWRSPLAVIGDLSCPTTKQLWQMLMRKFRRPSLDSRRSVTILFFLLASIPAQALRKIMSMVPASQKSMRS